jgi:hypothetical protein
VENRFPTDNTTQPFIHELVIYYLPDSFDSWKQIHAAAGRKKVFCSGKISRFTIEWLQIRFRTRNLARQSHNFASSSDPAKKNATLPATWFLP